MVNSCASPSTTMMGQGSSRRFSISGGSDDEIPSPRTPSPAQNENSQNALPVTPQPSHFIQVTEQIVETVDDFFTTPHPLSACIKRWTSSFQSKLNFTATDFIESRINQILRPIFKEIAQDFDKMLFEDTLLEVDLVKQIESGLNALPMIVRRPESGTVKKETIQREPLPSRTPVQQQLDYAYEGEDKDGRTYTNLHFNDFGVAKLYMPQVRALEILAHDFAYGIEETIEVPILTVNGFEKINYRVECIPIIGGYEAYGLVPVTANAAHPPILLFAGTTLDYSAEGLWARIMANFDPLGPGFTFFNLVCGDLEKWLKDHPQAIATGHSLGGAFAIYTTVYLSEYIKEAYTFACPAVSFFAAKRWEEKKEKPLLINFYHEKDYIPRCGYARVGHDVGMFVNTPTNLSEDEKIKNSSFAAEHRYSVLDNESLLIKAAVETLLPPWMQAALQVVLFLILTPLWVFILSWWLVFGHAKSVGFSYLLYPVHVVLNSGYHGISDFYYRIRNAWDSTFPVIETV